MPWNRRNYPANWDSEIRPDVLARAGHCCDGCTWYPDCRARNHQPHPVTGSRVVLTIAHLCDCTPPCDNRAHLKALCQRCYLKIDAALHARHTKQTRLRRLAEAHAAVGQGVLLK